MKMQLAGFLIAAVLTTIVKFPKALLDVIIGVIKKSPRDLLIINMAIYVLGIFTTWSVSSAAMIMFVANIIGVVAIVIYFIIMCYREIKLRYFIYATSLKAAESFLKGVF